MNFLPQGFRKLSSDRPIVASRQPTYIHDRNYNHAVSLMVKMYKVGYLSVNSPKLIFGLELELRLESGIGVLSVMAVSK